ncbi:MAG: hypothetical protein JO260_07955 [Acidobacteria bacterium]|nr:hypothetical protein [Acidobacteriota bacterium]
MSLVAFLRHFENRKEIAESAKKHPTRIIPMGSVLLDAPDVTQQIEELHDPLKSLAGRMYFSI